ncbi:tetratricopeptide repeat protein [Methylobacterium currus]|uniref:tetratricopeptide repeat protein n=1 Tax=Methylobacterium currus TaxID=2051553 RepID=UPI001E5BFE2D|nr:tetratricopeptide repeat protein [Methylobacterium currus]UHC17777.1 tetratricopeptide repeat protein [Methylobacterium currus]
MGSTGRSRRAAALIALAALTVGAGTADAAQLVAIQGSEQQNFGRIALTFDHGVKVTAKVTGGVLVVAFREPVTGQRERLAAEMPAYVAQVRRDPDGAGLRVALQASYKVNVLEAGERVFIDLMPEGWTGMPPGLPPEVLADLSRRAEELSERLRRDAVRARRTTPLRLEVAHLPTLTRLSVRLPREAEVEMERAGSEVRLRIPGAYTIESTEARAALRPAAAALAAEAGMEAARLTLTLAEGFTAEGYREDESYVLDLVKPAGKRPEDKKPEDKKPEDRKPVAAMPDPSPVPAARAEAPSPSEPRPQAETRPQAEAPAPAPAEPAASAGPVQARVARAGQGLRIAFPFAARPPAALFERGGIATLVFESTAAIALPSLPAGAPASVTEGPRAEGAFTVLRLRLDSGMIAQLAAGEGQGWDLVLGDTSLPGGDILAPQRSADPTGKPAVAVPLSRPGGALWLERDGERIAVATARGPRIAGLPKRGRFVEFELLPSRQGVAVLAAADDLAVRPGLAEVTITRPGGLSVSPTVVETPEAAQAAAQAAALLVQPDRWREDQRGDVRARIRAAQAAAAAAERPARSAARLDLVRVLLANDFAAEAAGVLALAVREDPALAAERPVRLLSAIAALRLDQDARAAGFLTPDGKRALDPELRLWRGVVDARGRRSAAAITAFKAGMPLIEAYPDDLQVQLYLSAVQAALDAKDPAFAQRALTAVSSLADAPQARDRLAFYKARFAEAIGQDGEARRTYQQIAETGAPAIAAEATLRGVDLGRATGTMTPEAAIDRLERLILTWHGEAEAEALARLGRLYAGVGRWRDAFATARKANRLFPDHPVTRGLHDDTVALFAALFLSDRGDSLGKIEALALFYDFKEFTPVGRQGDEIVRRLADRLVALDLLEAAGELLQHQVDNRLTGAARASVAARLATVRLMEGEPLKALKVLQNTRLPELPAQIRDARLLLEVRALSDLSRTDLALELLDGNTTPEAAHLRGDILWSARRWREAGEAHESLLGTRWREPGPLTDAERGDVMRAAIGYALAEDTLSLDRLRSKFTAKMAESPDARTFGLVASPNASGTAAFRSLVRQATSAETLTDFLRAYRARYPESAAPERPKPSPDGNPAQGAAPTPEARGAGGPSPG